jgi:hypothetical protein
MNGLRRLEMAKLDKKAAAFDLFDQGAISQPGERQTDIEDIIAEKSCGNNRGMKLNNFGKSLLALIQDGDEAGQQAWSNAAKAGEVMRIC